MWLLASLGLLAQTPDSAAKTDVAAPAPDTPAKPDVAPQDAVRAFDLAIPAEPKPADQAAPVSTSTSASALFNPVPEDALAPAPVPAANIELQSQVQEALGKDSSLSKSSVVVTASAEGIDLTGSAGSSRERLAAWRLAESYARGKRVENHIVVNVQGGPAPAAHENTTPAHSPPPTPSLPGIQDNRH